MDEFKRQELVIRAGVVVAFAVVVLAAGCAIRDAIHLPAQSNSAFNETLIDCVYRKLIEEPAWCPAEDQCVRPVVNRAEIEAHEASCRKEGAR